MATSGGPNIVTNGLVLHLDAGSTKSYSCSGTTWYDLSGNDNNGTLTNGPTFSSTTNSGVIQIDGTNDYINVQDMPTGNTWSILIWSLIDGPTTFATVGHRTYAATDNFRFQWDDKGVNQAYAPFTDFVSPVGSLIPSNFVNQTESDVFNKWNLVSMTCDGSVVKIYWNETEGTSTASARVFSNDGIMRIGYDGVSGIGGFDNFNRDGGNCYFGPIMVYNNSLTTKEILQNYEATKSRFNL